MRKIASTTLLCLALNLTVHSQSSSPINSIKIFNNQGQLVFEHPTSGSNSIDVSSLTNGLYLIQFIGDDTIETQHFEVLK